MHMLHVRLTGEKGHCMTHHSPRCHWMNEEVLERWRSKVGFYLFVVFLINLGVLLEDMLQG